MGKAIIHAGAVQTDINLPTWASEYPQLKIGPARQFADALVVDNFIQATSTVITSHTSNRQIDINEVDAPWVAQSGTINVLGGEASSPTVDNTNKIATKDLGAADVEIEATVRADSNSAIEGIAFRLADADEFFALSLRAEFGTAGLYLWKYTPVNNIALIASYVDASVIDENVRRIKVLAVGTSIKCYLDGIERISITNTGYTSNTKHGIVIRRGEILDFQAEAA